MAVARPRIAFFIDELFSGGAQRQSVELAVDLVRRERIDASFFVYRDDDFFSERLRRHRIPTVRVPKRGKVDPLFPLRLARAFRSFGAHLVHAFMLDPGVWAALAHRLPGRRPALLVSERWSLVATTRAMRAKQRFAYATADAVTSNAAVVAAAMLEKLGLPEQHVRVIPNGIDLATWDAGLAREPAIALEPGRFHIGAIGRLEPEKNQSLLIRAVAELDPDTRSRLRIWLVGSGAANAGCRPQLEREIRALGLSEIVRIEGPQRDIAPIIGALDLLVLPSQREAFPNAVLEAMASRVPVVATRVGAVPEMVSEGESGFIVEPGDARAMAAKIRNLLAMSTERRHAMGERGRQIVESRYRMETVGDRYLELYAEILANAER